MPRSGISNQPRLVLVCYASYILCFAQNIRPLRRSSSPQKGKNGLFAGSGVAAHFCDVLGYAEIATCRSCCLATSASNERGA